MRCRFLSFSWPGMCIGCSGLLVSFLQSSETKQQLLIEPESMLNARHYGPTGIRFSEYRVMKRDEIRNPEKGNINNVFWRAALGLVFLYLNFAAYQLIGLGGVIITSIFFLVAQFSPLVVRTFDKRWRAQFFSRTPVTINKSVVENKNAVSNLLHMVSQTENNG